jgi:hypothetical protein
MQMGILSISIAFYCFLSNLTAFKALWTIHPISGIDAPDRNASKIKLPAKLLGKLL